MKKKLSIVLIALALVACMTAVVCLAGCNKVNKDNVNSTAEANWNGTANRTATSVVSIEDLRLSLGEENYISLNFKATLERKIEGDKVTLTATFSDIEIAEFELGGDLSSLTTLLGSNLENLGSLLSGFVKEINNIDMTKLDEVSIKAVVTYDKSENKKELRVPELRILNASGLVDAEFKYADESDVDLDNFDLIKVIKSMNGNYDLVVNMGDLFNTAAGFTGTLESMIGLKLNVEELVNNIFFGQTLINIEADKSKAEFADNTFTNRVGGYDTLSFLLDPIKNNLKPKANPSDEDGLYEIASNLAIIADDTVGARIDAIMDSYAKREENPIRKQVLTVGDIMAHPNYADFKDVVVNDAGLTVDAFFKTFNATDRYAGPVEDSDDLYTVRDFIIKEGLYVGELFDAIGGDNAIQTLLGYFNFGSSNVTANYNGTFFDKITVRTTGVEINVPSKLLDKLIAIIGNVSGLDIKEELGKILDGALLGLYDTILGNGITLSIGTINVVNTYAAA